MRDAQRKLETSNFSETVIKVADARTGGQFVDADQK